MASGSSRRAEGWREWKRADGAHEGHAGAIYPLYVVVQSLMIFLIVVSVYGVLLQMVAQGKRPALPPDTDPQLSSVINKCWAQDPDARPPFKQVVGFLKQLAKSNGFALPRD